jgi:DNA helicase-2/ATP-dependent DNA helicase PcrA
LIQEYNIPEENILVITFTRAAAGEMKERFLKLSGEGKTGVSFGTFHSTFFTILKYAYRLSPENIIREEERRSCAKEIVSGMGLEYEDEKEYISELLSEISMVKGNRIELATYYSLSCADEVFRHIYHEYNKRIRRAKKIDFDDMLLLCYQLLSKRPDILGQWQKKFKYILVDEFQDINILQYDIVRMLTAPLNNLFIVGDDDQSIYRFRGAKPEIMLNFQSDYPESKRIFLNLNYRSNIHIIDCASHLISHNKARFEKKILANIKGGDNQVVIGHFETITEQNLSLVEEIIRLAKMNVSFLDMAILVRTNLGAGAILHKLMEYNIPFTAGDNLPNIYDHWITQDLVSYIRIAMGDNSRGLYLRIINRPTRYISRECFDNPLVSISKIHDYYEDKKWMLQRINQMEYDLAMLKKMKPFAAIQYIRRGIGYEDFLKGYAANRKMKFEELEDVIDEIQESTRGFDSYEAWFTYMEEYKEELKRQTQNSNSKGEGVNIMTMHGSKGLEFSIVFIIDVNEGIMPHKKAVLPENIEEERRLFYVAMTRAKKQLYIFSSKQRYNKTMVPSRFISEISEDRFGASK